RFASRTTSRSSATSESATWTSTASSGFCTVVGAVGSSRRSSSSRARRSRRERSRPWRSPISSRRSRQPLTAGILAAGAGVKRETLRGPSGPSVKRETLAGPSGPSVKRETLAGPSGPGVKRETLAASVKRETPGSAVPEWSDDEVAIGLGAPRVGLDVAALAQVLVDELALARGHHVERHGAAAPNGRLGGGVGLPAQRRRAAIAVAGRVDNHANVRRLPAKRDSLGQVLDGLDRR